MTIRQRGVRECVRALLITPEPSVLLARLSAASRLSGTRRDLWIAPGGGIEAGESHRSALLRELAEETARESFDVGPLVWIREATFLWDGRTIPEREHFYLIRTERFEPDPSRNPKLEERKILTEFRWWLIPDLARSRDEFAPARLAALLSDLIEDGPPRVPVLTGA